MLWPLFFENLTEKILDPLKKGTNGWLGFIPFEFNDEIIQKALDEIKPEKCPVTLRSPAFARNRTIK